MMTDENAVNSDERPSPLKLASDDWELVAKPNLFEKLYKKFEGRFKLRVGLGLIILMLAVSSDIPAGPVIVTDELSFEVVNLMEEAGEACRAVRDFRESSCAAEVWEACHRANQDLNDLKQSPSFGEIDAVGYLCDLAVIADAGNLTKSLAFRYGDNYYRSGWFKTVKTDEGIASFLLFQDLLYVELNALINPVDIDAHLVDSFIIWTPVRSATENLRRYAGYNDMSGDTEKKLIALRSSVRYSFRPYTGYGSVYYGDFYAVGIREDQDWQAINKNLWRKPPGLELSDEVTERNCSEARTALRENQLDRDRLLDRCSRLADTCEERADGFSVSCSLARGAAEFESMWQNLPEVCAQADERVVNPANAEEPTSDACYQAALAICQYQNVSPEDEWVDQLISMRDFACAAASRTPDLLYVKVDDRVPEYQP